MSRSFARAFRASFKGLFAPQKKVVIKTVQSVWHSRRTVLFLESLEALILPTTDVFTSSLGGTWSLGSNWSLTAPPTSIQDATVTPGAGVTVTHASGSDTVHTLMSDGSLIVSGGSLSVTGDIGGLVNVSGSGLLYLSGTGATQGNVTLELSGGTTVTLSGNIDNTGHTLTVDGTGTLVVSGTLTGGTVDLTNGAALNLQGGTISGGTIGGTGGSNLVLTGYGGTLAGGVMIAAGVTLDGTQFIVGQPYANVTGGLTLNGPANLGNAGGNVDGQLYFLGTQTLSGSATVTFGSSTGNALYAQYNGSSAILTIASSITIQGGSGIVKGYFTANGDSVVLNGPINIPSGQTLAVGGANWVNNNAITANGATVTLSGSWVNNGSIIANGATVNLGDSFNTAALVNFACTGGTVNLTGTLNNAGSTLALAPALGAWVLHGGTISGGTVSSTGGSELTLSGYGGTLAGVTLAAGVTVDGTQFIVGQPYANVTGGLTLNGAANLGNASGNVLGQLYFLGTQTLSGSATVTFGSSTGNALYAQYNGSSAILTIASSITIQGGSGIVKGYFTANGDSVVLNGPINIPSGQTLAVGGANWVNNNAITANGATVTLSGSWVNNGSIIANGATVNLGDSFNTAALVNFACTGGTVNLTGTLNNAGSTLALAPALGAWVLHGGTISGGTVSSTGGSELTLSGYGGTLAGVTLAAGVTVDGTQFIVGQPYANVTGGLTLNGAANLGNASGNVLGQLYFLGTQTLSGSGTVTFGGSTSNALYADGNGSAATLTIASGITVQGGSGVVKGYYTSNGDSIVLNGPINIPSGQTLAVGGAYWVNKGSITANGATVNLGDSFSTASLVNFACTGGTVNLTGTLNNAGTTLALAPALGAWVLHGGTISGGTVSSTGSSPLVLTGYGGTLAGVTLAAGVTLDGTQFIGGQPYANVTGGLTLNGPANLGNSSGNLLGQLYFLGTQTLSGSGTVTFGGSTSNALYADGNGSAATLTIASGITVQGGSGVVKGYYTVDSVVLNGVVAANTSGGTISVGSGGSGSTLANFTALTATNGAALNVAESLQINGSATVTTSATSSLNVSGNLLGTTQNPANFEPQGTLTLNGAGIATAPQLLEAMSADFGNGANGFNNNFAYGTLVIGSNNYVKLVNQSVNSPGSTAEAVYANSLTVPAGSTLNLNGLNLYVPLGQTHVAGTITGGSLSAPTAPPAPTGLTALPNGAGAIFVEWANVSGAADYILFRGQSANGPWTQIYLNAQSQYNDSNDPTPHLIPGQAYYYYVVAVNAAGNSPNSSLYGPVMPNASPAVPTNLQAVAQTGSPEIDLTWGAVGGAEYYQVERSTSPNSGFLQVGDAVQGNYPDTSVFVGVPYYYRVRAVVNGIASDPSPVSTAIITPMQHYPAAPGALPTLTAPVYSGIAKVYKWVWSSQSWLLILGQPAGPQQTFVNNLTSINWNNQTIIMTHGWIAGLDLSGNDWMGIFAKQFMMGRTVGNLNPALNLTNFNILAVDWNDGNNPDGSNPSEVSSFAQENMQRGLLGSLSDAEESMANGVKIAGPLAQALVAAGIEPGKVMLIGHSNGAGFMAQMAATIHQSSGQNIYELDALDAPPETNSQELVQEYAPLVDYVSNYYQPQVEGPNINFSSYGTWDLSESVGTPILSSSWNTTNYELNISDSDQISSFGISGLLGHIQVAMRYALTASAATVPAPWGFQESPFINGGSKGLSVFIYQEQQPLKDSEGGVFVALPFLPADVATVESAIVSLYQQIKSLYNQGLSIWNSTVQVVQNIANAWNGLNSTLTQAFDSWQPDFTAHSPVYGTVDVNVPANATLLHLDIQVQNPGNNDTLQVALGNQIVGSIDLTTAALLGDSSADFWVGDFAGQTTQLQFYMPSDIASSAIFSVSDLTFETLAAPFVQSINRTTPGGPSTNAGSVTYMVTFSEAVTGVDASDFILTTSGVTGASITNVSPAEPAATYAVTVSGISGSGTLGLNLVDNGTIRGPAGNSLTQANAPAAFASQTTFATASGPSALAVADVNADGQADLVTANSAGNDVSVLLGNGNGSFHAAQNFPTDLNPHAVMVADVNGDGRPDLVTANGAGTVSVLLGNGNGTFQAPMNYKVGLDPRSVAVGDVNGDGELDLVTANYGSNTVSLLLGNGDGTFQAAQNFNVGTQPDSVALSDLNGDGSLDLVVANHGSANVSVLLGNGNGTFQNQTTFATGTYPGAVTAADVNGDDKPDLVVANKGSASVSVLLGNGNGTFQAQQTFATGTFPVAVAVADVNGDGKPDLAVANYLSASVSVLLGNGNGTFQNQTTFAAGAGPRSLALADVNGDARPDLVTVNFGNNDADVLLNALRGNFVGQLYVIVGPATHFTVPTPAGITAGSPFSETVTALDASNNVAIGYSGNVTMAIGAGSPSTTLNGTLTVTASGGVATFSNLSITKAGSGYTLTASDTGLSGATASGFAITPAAANQLAFGQQPVNTAAGSTLAPAVTVKIEDPFGNLESSDSTDQVTLGIASGPGTATIVAGTSGATESGNTVTITTTAGAGYTTGQTVVIAAVGVAGYNGTFTITGTPTGTTFTYMDPISGLATAGGGTATVTPTFSTGSTTTATVHNGLATFTNLSLTSAGSYTLSASTTGGLSGPASSPFMVTLVVPPGGFMATPTGFTVKFTQAVNPSSINLTGPTATDGPVAVTLVGSGIIGPISGSLYQDPTDTQLTFVKTVVDGANGLPVPTGSLPLGTYTVTLVSGSSALTTTNGVTLDGNSDGTAGDNYTATFHVVSSNPAPGDVLLPSATVLVTAPDFARGPLTPSVTIAGSNGATESGNTVTITTTLAHAFSVGQTVTITGVGVSGYNGTFTITSVPSSPAINTSPTTFTYTDPTSGLGASGGGTANVPGINVANNSGNGIPIDLTVLAPVQILTFSSGITTGTTGTFKLGFNSQTTANITVGTAIKAQTASASTSGASESGTTVTIRTATVTGLKVGASVTINGVGVSGYNGTFTVTGVPTTTSFTYTGSTSGLALSGGGTWNLSSGTALATAIQNALGALSVVGGTANVAVTGTGPFTVTFAGAVANPNLMTVAANTIAGAPTLTIVNPNAPASVTDATLVLSYNANLLNITGGTVNASLPGSPTFTVNTSGSGAAAQATITFHSNAALNLGMLGSVDLGGLVATVPSTAPYKSKMLLHFVSESLNGGTLTAAGVDGYQVVAYQGDTDGNGSFSGNDQTLLNGVAGGSSPGFAAFRQVDPVIIGGLSSGTAISATDSGLLASYLNGVAIPQVPDQTGVTPTLFVPGPDPTVSIPTDLSVGANGTVVVPVNLDDARPAGSTGLTQAELALTYDPAEFTVSAADVQLGTIPLSGSGWTLSTVVDALTGQLAITLLSQTPIATSLGGSLVTIALHRTGTTLTGMTPITLAASVDPNGQGMFPTALFDTDNRFILSPAPNNAVPDASARVRLEASPATAAMLVRPDGDAPATSVPVAPALDTQRLAPAPQAAEVQPLATAEGAGVSEPETDSARPSGLRSVRSDGLAADVVPMPPATVVVVSAPAVSLAVLSGAPILVNTLTDRLLLTGTPARLDPAGPWPGPGAIEDSLNTLLAAVWVRSRSARDTFESQVWDGAILGDLVALAAPASQVDGTSALSRGWVSEMAQDQTQSDEDGDVLP